MRCATELPADRVVRAQRCPVRLQIAAFPEPDTAERGRIEVHVMAHAPAGGVTDLDILADDLVDVLAASPVRWTFDPVRSRTTSSGRAPHWNPCTRPRSPDARTGHPPGWNTFGCSTGASDIDGSLLTC
jgi:hypothetical protein